MKTDDSGNPVPAFSAQKAKLPPLLTAVLLRGLVHADEEPHERFEVKRTDHQEARSLDGARTNGTEGFFRR
jgi:hypothetical protein